MTLANAICRSSDGIDAGKSEFSLLCDSDRPGRQPDDSRSGINNVNNRCHLSSAKTTGRFNPIGTATSFRQLQCCGERLGCGERLENFSAADKGKRQASQMKKTRHRRNCNLCCGGVQKQLQNLATKRRHANAVPISDDSANPIVREIGAGHLRLESLALARHHPEMHRAPLPAYRPFRTYRQRSRASAPRLSPPVDVARMHRPLY